MKIRARRFTGFVCILLILFGVHTHIRPGYSMYIGKNFVGTVHSRAEAAAILDILSAEINTPPFSPRLYLRFLSPKKFSAPSEILAAIKSQSDIQTEIVTENEEVPYENETVKDETLYVGEEIVTREGTLGSRTTIKEITRVNGIFTNEKILSSHIITAPISKITSIGTKEKPLGIGTGDFMFPLNEITVSSGFGSRWGRQHKGIDLAAEEGTPILASDAGTVTYSGPCDGYGNLIILNHKNGYTSYYAHCSVLHAAVGDTPKKGDIIASVGSSGNSTGPHLHFEIRKDGQAVNPEAFFPATLF